MTISPVGGIERRQIHVGHGVDHKPRQMIGGQPLPHIRRQQKALLTPAFYEVLRHTGIPLTGADGPPLRDSLDELRSSASATSSRPLFVGSKRPPTNTPTNLRARQITLRAKPAMTAPRQWSQRRKARLR